jgi:hypothetical protein
MKIEEGGRITSNNKLAVPYHAIVSSVAKSRHGLFLFVKL